MTHYPFFRLSPGLLPITVLALTLAVFSPFSPAQDEDTPSPFSLFSDPEDRATYEWLLERSADQPYAHYGRKGELEWIGFEGESKYTCSLYLDEEGRVVKMMFNKLGFHNDELEQLAGFRHVREITCAHNFDENGPNAYREGPNPVSGTGWIAFKDHPIEFFKIGGCPFDGDGLEALAHFPNLRRLSVFHTRVNDEDLAVLEGHPALEWIHAGPMWDDKITDAALVRLARVPNLKGVKIVETFLTYENGFRHLVEAHGDQLETIELGNTLMPLADRETLREALPDAEITQDSVEEIGKLVVDNWKGADRKLGKWAPAEVIEAYRAAAE